jgi:hypothetical protein
MIKILLQDTSTAWAIPWYTVMVTIQIVSLVYCAILFKRYLASKDGKDATYRKWMLIFGVIFTVVSAYRSIAVWATPYTFRIPNTFAEIAFACIIAYAMLQFNTYLPVTDDARPNKFKSFIAKTPYILVGCIVLAQPIDTWGGITRFALRGVYVETLWALGFLSILPLAIIQLRRVFSIKDKETAERLRLLKYTTIIIAAWCVIYCMYRWIFTLPGMWEYAFAQLKAGLPPIITGQEALTNALGVSRRTPEDFSFGFLMWHSAYFSVLTWISIFLMQAPRPLEFPRKSIAKQSQITLVLIAVGLITLLTVLSFPAEGFEIIMLLVLGGLLLIPIGFILVLEIKRGKLETKT